MSPRSSADLDRIWQLRENVSPYDAAYVALGVALVTADRRLSHAPEIGCQLVVLGSSPS
ncbi:MAG: hypothetical protein ACR2G7_09325 [Acidimicrobiales bacterium]